MDQKKTGALIARCRKETGLTQAQLAEQLGVTDKAVSKWETGKCLPDISLFDGLCGILGITPNELLAGERGSAQGNQDTGETEEKHPLVPPAECQRKRAGSTLCKAGLLLLLLLGASVHMSVGGLHLDGSPVFANLLLTLLLIILWGFTLKLTSNEARVQKALCLFSGFVLLSCALSFGLAFWDVGEPILVWVRLPLGLLFYGLRPMAGWLPIYGLAGVLSFLSYHYSKKNLRKRSNSCTT